MKRIFAFLLVLCMTAAALTGCGDTKKLLGSWQAQLDLTDAMQQALQLEGFSEDYQVESFQVTATLTFLEDHTYTLALDEASVEAASEALLKKLEEHMLKAMEDELAALGLTATLEQLFEHTGIDLDTLFSKMRQTFADSKLAENLAEQVAATGQFKLSDGKLYLSADPQAEPESDHVGYTLEENRLTLSSPSGSLPTENLVLSLDGICFQKAQ